MPLPILAYKYIQKSSGGKKRLKKSLRRAADITIQETSEMKQRRMAQEEAYATIRSQLGAEGTYDTPTAGAGPTVGAPTDGTDLFKTAELGRGIRFASGATSAVAGQIPDPQKIAAMTLGSTEGRIASRLTAEAEQLIKREGPLWDEMSKSVMGPIIEGSASFMQEQAEGLRRMYARGGAARNRARQGMQQIRVAEQANRVKSTQLWNSKLALNQWARDNARTQLRFNESWASNAPGVRDSFYNHLDNISEFMIKTALPMALDFQAGAVRVAEQQKAEKRAKIQKIAGFAIAAAAVLTGGLALAGVGAVGAGGAAGLFGQAVTGLGGGGALLRTGLSGALQLGMGVQPGSVAQQQIGLLGQIRGSTTTETESEAGRNPGALTTPATQFPGISQ